GKKGRAINYDGFFLFLRAVGRSKITIKDYQADLRFWNRFVKGINKTIYSLKLRDIEIAVDGKDINTARRLVATLKSLARWYLRESYPALYIELEKVVLGKRKDRIVKAKDIEEFKRIRAQAEDLVKLGDRKGIWLGLMLLCGLRISEIYTAEPGNGWVQVLGKGNKERRIPCPEWLLQAMKNSRKKEYRGYQKGKRYIDYCLRQMGYKNLHSLRHTYATYLLNQGIRIEGIKELLGHASIATTQIYAKSKIPEGICEILAA
ncbi:MAG: tyrosine-type recombinase/integrase, partial [Candidatus Margulisiibacteriota bacterium]